MLHTFTLKLFKLNFHSLDDTHNFKRLKIFRICFNLSKLQFKVLLKTDKNKYKHDLLSKRNCIQLQRDDYLKKR